MAQLRLLAARAKSVPLTPLPPAGAFQWVFCVFHLRQDIQGPSPARCGHPEVPPEGHQASIPPSPSELGTVTPTDHRQPPPAQGRAAGAARGKDLLSIPSGQLSGSGREGIEGGKVGPLLALSRSPAVQEQPPRLRAPYSLVLGLFVPFHHQLEMRRSSLPTRLQNPTERTLEGSGMAAESPQAQGHGHGHRDYPPLPHPLSSPSHAALHFQVLRAQGGRLKAAHLCTHGGSGR